MIEENVETYSCEDIECGRKFQNQNKLLEHYKRRHLKLYQNKINTNLITFNNNSDNSLQIKSNKILDEIYDKISQIEKETKFVKTSSGFDYLDSDSEEDKNNLKIVEEENYEDLNINRDYENINESEIIPDENNSDSINITSSLNMTNSSFGEKVSIVTDEMIGIGTIYSDYDEVNDINLEDKNLLCFRTKRNVNFNYLLYLTHLNISKNLIKDISHLTNLNTIKVLNISQNRIDDITSLENLEYLEILLAEKNEISSISSLNRCKKIIQLELADNKIKYESSSYKTLKNLEKLKELTIKNNPFLNEVFGYKHLFIQKYPKILKLDKEDINELDREVAVNFMNENSILNKEISRPFSSKIETAKNIIEENNINDKIELKDNPVIVKDKIISKLEYSNPIKTSSKIKNISQKSSHPLRILQKNNLDLNKKTFTNINPNTQLKNELDEIRKENKLLGEKNKQNELEMESLKTELENLLNLNKEYEKIIKENELKLKNNSDEEKIKLKKEVELWKKEYCDLLDKSMSTNVSTSRLLNSTDDRDKIRPYTAKLIGYEKTLEDLNNFKNESLNLRSKRKNSLDDSLNNSVDKEEDNSDNEIDDLLRKSVTNLANLKQEIK